MKKRLLAVLLCLCMPTVMISCKKDDDPDNSNKSSADNNETAISASSYELKKEEYTDENNTLEKYDKADAVTLIFPEGCTIDYIIDTLMLYGIRNSRQDYIEVIEEYPFDYEFVKAIDDADLKEGRKYRLEGYMFPGEYTIEFDADPVKIIDSFLARFDENFTQEYYERAKELGMTVDEIITLASIVQAETDVIHDMGKVSSVYHNRLYVYPYLCSDETLLYDKDYKPSEDRDAYSDDYSPYDTYRNKGFPPSAITNPGHYAITYALYPEDTKYCYFVKDPESGRMHFSTTLEEHNEVLDSLVKTAESE